MPARPTTADQPPVNASSAIAPELVAVAVVLAIVEGVVLWSCAAGSLNWPVYLLLHAVIVAVMLAWIDKRGKDKREVGSLLLVTFLFAAIGPIGAIASIALLPRSTWQPEQPELLANWYERIANAVETDEVTRLCELVATGRTSDLGGNAPGSFTAIMDRGTIDDRQAALGVIARNFHTDYLTALLLALKNEEPVIRVQAAAVATKVRGDLRTLIDRIATTTAALSAGTPAALSTAAQLDAAVASDLLDEGDRIRARVLADRLKVQTSSPRRPALRAVPIVDRHAVEAALIANSQFSRLRVGRRIAAVETGRVFRVRRARTIMRMKAG